MNLIKVQVTNFRSIWDTTEFDIDDVTCLVGKNESGKTAILHALHRLNPKEGAESGIEFLAETDFPRRGLADYASSGESAVVVKATFALERPEIIAAESMFGQDCFDTDEPFLILSKDYFNRFTAEMPVNENNIIGFLIDGVPLSETAERILSDPDDLDGFLTYLKNSDHGYEEVDNLIKMLDLIVSRGISNCIFEKIIKMYVPKFFYFDEYYQMKGQDNLDNLNDRRQNFQLLPSDLPLLGLIDLAGLDLCELLEPRRTTTLRAKLEATANKLTERVLSHWSQNQHLRMTFDVRPGYPDDPPGMDSGTNIWGFVEDTVHNASTELGSRSKGFVWFFSFLAWYSKLHQDESNFILLLDEPGLSLHGRAQEDFLRYVDKELKPHHQLIYTTHSPFMVDPQNMDQVRIVQDMSIERDPTGLAEDESGTKVLSEIHKATQDTLFPLQGALGYEIYQNLFIGPNCLIVEGVSDLLYIDTINGLLQSKGERGLDGDWTITPVGGISNVPTFVALIGAQGKLNLALLIDNRKSDQQKIDNLYREKLLAKNKIVTYANFVSSLEADVEDMFEPDFYLSLVNGAYGVSIEEANLCPGSLTLRRLEQYLTIKPLPNDVKFNHYRPAQYLSANIETLKDGLTEQSLNRWREAFASLNSLLGK